jgi:hypothetical protein
LVGVVDDDCPGMNSDHFREYVLVFEHFLDRHVNTNCGKKINFPTFVLSLDDDSAVLGQPNTTETKRLGEINHASITADSEFGTKLRANYNDIIIIFFRLDSLPTEYIILFGSLIDLIISHVSICQNIILQFRNQERLAVQNERIPSLCP